MNGVPSSVTQRLEDGRREDMCGYTRLPHFYLFLERKGRFLQIKPFLDITRGVRPSFTPGVQCPDGFAF
ncbi:hypothetical protein M413DRAFT_449746 [Hebeloma cylindrosporum]|uniref:Uncharacterized protein n=1 Tax=Hebeloma cylindrosporum TaxID=76867 RepID=A0A0C3BF89_HEBCY|nr:hypothetical protein M413DRAFT_449746 [Hebeloma cylindrosporum h7]